MHFKIIMTSWVVLFVAALTLLRCATDPGSTTSIGGAGAFQYDTADFDLVVKQSEDKIYVGAILFTTDENGERIQASSIEDGLTFSWPTPSEIAITFTEQTTRSSVRPCDQNYTFLSQTSGTTFSLYTFSTTSSCAASATASLTISKNGQSRVLTGSATSTPSTSSNTLTHYTAFVTSVSSYTGNLGGLSGADAKCVTRAAAGAVTASIGTNWKAIVSGTTVSAASRLEFAAGLPILNTNGDIVKSLATALWSGTLTNAIKFDENGALISSGLVYTGTTAAGASDVVGFNQYNCLSWTSNSGSRGPGNYEPRVGNLTSISSTWIYHTIQSCVGTYRIYCINQ